MKIAVFGCGFVGGTVANFLENRNVEVIRVDPKLYPNIDPVESVMYSDGIIICVPTPSSDDGTCDDSIVREVLELTDYRTRILLKSTVTYDNVKTYPTQLVYNPEFLREKHAKDDFYNQQFAVYGYNEHAADDAVWWNELFGFEPVYTDLVTASLIKYVHNSWLATKVAWFHELYKNMPPGANYHDLTKTLSMFPNIGPSHMSAPNDQGTLGYTGHCFPKDVSALTKALDHSILEYVHKINQSLNKHKI